MELFKFFAKWESEGGSEKGTERKDFFKYLLVSKVKNGMKKTE
jgi:hypothetical protein